MIGNKLNYCKSCGAIGKWYRNPAKDVPAIDKDGNRVIVEYSYRCICGETTRNTSPNYLEGL